MGKKYNEKTPAIIISAKIAKRLQQDLEEELVNHIRAGGTYTEAIGKFDIPSNYGCTNNIAHSSIRLAYAGFPGSQSIEPFEGLISDFERKRLVHRKKREKGLQNFQERTGIFRISPERRRKISSEVGKITGKATLEKRIGIHGLTEKQKAEAQRLSALARGTTPWTDEQKKYLFQALQEPEAYLADGRINLKGISGKYNSQFPSRTNAAIGAAIRKLGTSPYS